MTKKFAPKKLPFRQKVWISTNDVHIQGRAVAITSIGIRHGDMGFPLGKRVQRVLGQPLGAEKGLILSEGVSNKMLPREIVGRPNVRNIESNAPIKHTLGNRILDMSQPRGLLLFGTILGIAIPPNIKRLIGSALFEPEIVHTLPQRLSVENDVAGRRVSFFCKQLGVSRKEFIAGFNIVKTVGSLFMAANAISEIRLSRAKSASIVTGFGHTNEIHKFMSRPKIAIRYIDMLMRKLPRTANSFGIILELRFSKRLFEQEVEIMHRKHNS